MRESASGKWQGSVRRSPSGVSHSAMIVNVGSRDRLAMQVRVAVEEVADDLDAFLRLERAGAIDEDAAWLGQLDRLRDEPPLQSRERGDVGLALEPGDIGVAADGAGRRAGRIEQDGVERLGLPLRHVGGDGFGRRDAGGPGSAAAVRAGPVRGRPRRPGRRRRRVGRSCRPGAAQRSATARPRTSPRSFAGSAAAASCTHQAPSA